MANPRVKAKIEARIRERVAYCIEFELNDPRSTFITITRVEISDDLGAAKIFYSVYGSESDKNKAAFMLEDATGFVRKRLGRVLKTRRIPRLGWLYDDSIEFSANMAKRIGEALEHDREVNPEAHLELESKKQAKEEPPDPLDGEYREFLDAQDEEER